MKAIIVNEYGDSNVNELTDVPIPTPRDHEVLIDVEAVGVNFADIVQRRGEYPGRQEPPYIPGREAAGVIEAVGDDVADYEVGDRVVAFVPIGAYAEKAVAEASTLFTVPSSISFEEAAGFPVQFLTAHHVLHEWGRLRADERVLIHAAAGGVGTATVQLANRTEAEVFATASSDEKLDLAAELGADHCINYSDSDFVAEIENVTDGEGVELIVDGVGGQVFNDSLDALAHFGRLVTYGFASGKIETVDTGRLLFENKSVIGFHLGNALERDPERMYSVVSELSDGLNDGDLRVVVGETFDLEEAAAAQSLIENRNSTGKVVLVP